MKAQAAKSRGKRSVARKPTQGAALTRLVVMDALRTWLIPTVAAAAGFLIFVLYNVELLDESVAVTIGCATPSESFAATASACAASSPDGGGRGGGAPTAVIAALASAVVTAGCAPWAFEVEAAFARIAGGDGRPTATAAAFVSAAVTAG